MRFDSYHPVISVYFFVVAILCAIYFNHPIFLMISYISSFLYSVKLNRRRALVFDLILIVLIVVYALWFSSYNHFGVTNIRQNIVGNQITLESLIYGLVVGIIMACVMMWMTCVFTIISSDKIIYLFGRITPKFSLFLAVMLRTVPMIRRRLKITATARSCIGKGVSQGGFFRRFVNRSRVISSLIVWSIESLVQSSDSMRSRGYSLRKRTAFSIYRFDNRDRTLILILFLYSMIIITSVFLDQTTILYNPEIIWNRITPGSYLFYVSYLLFCLLPMFLQIYWEIKFRRIRV